MIRVRVARSDPWILKEHMYPPRASRLISFLSFIFWHGKMTLPFVAANRICHPCPPRRLTPATTTPSISPFALLRNAVAVPPSPTSPIPCSYSAKTTMTTMEECRTLPLARNTLPPLARSWRRPSPVWLLRSGRRVILPHLHSALHLKPLLELLLL